jgi:phage shock protein PspC (stress-responsive transcriptional regulator)
MVMPLVPLVPWVTVTFAGDAETLKFGWDAAFTVRVTAVVSVVLPEVPLTVMLYVPAATAAGTVRVMVEVPAPVIELGLKLTFTPVGCPVAVKEMAELNPPTTELVMVAVPELPCATVTEDGEADKLKLGFDELPASALIRPVPCGLPQPVAKSYPLVAE